ncbi:hypothetical protein [Mesorhizobium sp. M1329]|uniref:hypothetical protein n=1 Tax=Mesorhizobium sp. M1329 TaxID=2957083 RepID=UPI00333A9C30
MDHHSGNLGCVLASMFRACWQAMRSTASSSCHRWDIGPNRSCAKSRQYDFFANGDTEPFEGDYQALPICGVGGDEPGTLRVLDHPEQSVMMGIAAALKGFRPGRTPALN